MFIWNQKILKHLLCHWTIIIMGFNDVARFAPVQYSSSSAQLGVCGPVSCVLVCPCEVECRSVYIMVCRRPRFWCAMTTRALSAQRGLWEHSTASIPPWKVVECVLVWKKAPKKQKKASYVGMHHVCFYFLTNSMCVTASFMDAGKWKSSVAAEALKYRAYIKRPGRPLTAYLSLFV